MAVYRPLSVAMQGKCSYARKVRLVLCLIVNIAMIDTLITKFRLFIRHYNVIVLLKPIQIFNQKPLFFS
ncbi:hypothetical membrane protein [Candidatus Protochlamydia naegleriophila]|uniref:Hypothetical membrane protein n=1 Tax=Candidatus Protochlamydia naegleriophila TaxID=389348 RepID=A0A0U5JFY0_9BACT|nr:hypothetical membrane protein [Candidatus Protochlamydia naegleriophila]